MIFSRELGIDLGTSTTLLVDRKGHILIDEPSVAAADVKTKRVLATGIKAKEMIGRTPGSIVPIMPIRDGVIADFDMTADMLHNFIMRSSKRGMFTKTGVVINVPSGVTEVERRAVEDAARAAGAQDVVLVESPMAAALGVGLPVNEATGSMIVDFGGGTCDIAVLALGGIASCKSVRIGGDALNEEIMNYLKKERGLLIGEKTAEDIKIKIGSAAEYDGEAALEVKGRKIENGLPAAEVVTSAEIREVIKPSIDQIIASVKETLEITLPDLAADILDRGIYLTGGGAKLRGLKDRIEREVMIPVIIPQNPENCVALGTSVMLRKNIF